jgi:uncharacterized PurR-regulated membrane protein YhhQ (DUF165 family)
LSSSPRTSSCSSRWTRRFAGINLADLLTWGAFTYPIAFLITDLTNRQFGPQAARKVVFAGFVVGVHARFSRLCRASRSPPARPIWPVSSSTSRLQSAAPSGLVAGAAARLAVGSMLDTVIFFSFAFAAFFVFFGPNDPLRAPLFSAFFRRRRPDPRRFLG